VHRKESVKLAASHGKKIPVELDESDVIAFDRYLESKGNSKTTRAGRYGTFAVSCGIVA